MKKLTFILALAVLIPFSSSAAMTLDDVLQLKGNFEKESVKSPKVLGASTITGTPAPVVSLPDGAPEKLIKGLKYVKGSNKIIDQKLKKGSKGDQVKMLQVFLGAVGHNVPVTGTFGSKTEKAVKEPPGDYHLKADGVVGKTTQDKIAEEVGTVVNK